MVASFYRGYSTVNRQGVNSELYDIELVKQDLRNEFMTRLGERRMRPRFGSIIWDLLMEPSDETSQSAILADATRICQADPRVSINNISMNVSPDQQQITVICDLYFVEFNMDDEFSVTFTFSGADQ